MKEATLGCTVKAGANLDAQKSEEKRHSWWGPSQTHACWQEVKGSVLPGVATRSAIMEERRVQERRVQHHGQGFARGVDL